MGSSAPPAPFCCSRCGTVLGYTAPGEATRLGKRSRLFCAECKDAPEELTEREQEFLAAARVLRDSGEVVTTTKVGKAIGLSVSRAQQITTQIRARGMGEVLDEAMGRSAAPPPVVAPVPTPVPEVAPEVAEPSAVEPVSFAPFPDAEGIAPPPPAAIPVSTDHPPYSSV
jgi:hypothetical protein